MEKIDNGDSSIESSDNATPGGFGFAGIGLITAAVLFLLFAWPALTLLIGIYSNDDDYSHGIIVPLMSAYATYQIWKQTDRKILYPSWLGIPILALGILIGVGGHWYNIALLPGGLGVGFVQALGLILCIIGGYVMIGGPPTTRIFFFPIAYLMFAIPFPKSMTLPLTLSLRSVVSSVSEKMINALGILVFREGNVLHLANVSLGVEDACSGIRSFWMLTAIAAALAYLIKMGLIESLLLCLLTMPISIIMNIFRVTITGVLVHNFGIEYASGWRHELCGWLTFIGGLGGVFGIGSLLSSVTIGNEREIPMSLEQFRIGFLKVINQVPGPRFTTLLFSAGMLFAVGASANFVINHHYRLVEDPTFLDRKPLSDFPDQIGPYVKIGDGKIGDPALDMLQPTEHLIRYYRNDKGEVVELRVIYWNPLQYRYSEKTNAVSPGVSGHIPDRCFPAWGYDRIKEFEFDNELKGISNRPVSMRIFRKSQHDRCVLFWYEAREHVLYDVNTDLKWRAKKLIESWHQPFNQRHAEQYVVTIVADVSTSVNSARSLALHFAHEIASLLPEYGIE